MKDKENYSLTSEEFFRFISLALRTLQVSNCVDRNPKAAKSEKISRKRAS